MIFVRKKNLLSTKFTFDFSTKSWRQIVSRLMRMMSPSSSVTDENHQSERSAVNDSIASSPEANSMGLPKTLSITSSSPWWTHDRSFGHDCSTFLINRDLFHQPCTTFSQQLITTITQPCLQRCHTQTYRCYCYCCRSQCM